MLVKERFPIEIDTIDGITPLHIAAMKGNSEIVKILIENGANVNYRTLNRETPLHFAAKSGSYETVLALVKKGAIAISDEKMVTPIDIAEKGNSAHKDMIIYFLKLTQDKNKGIELIKGKDEKDFCDFCTQNMDRIELYGKQYLLNAAKYNKNRIISFLLKNKVSTDITDDESPHNTILHYAAMNNNEGLVCILIQKGAKFVKNDDGKTPLDFATNQVVRLILGVEFCNEQVSPEVCCAAIKSKRKGLLISILNNNFDVDSVNSKGKPILCYAVANGERSIVRLLLSHSPTLIKSTKNGVTALHIAASKNHVDIAKDLIKAGLPPTKDSFGKEPLDYAQSKEMEDLLSQYSSFMKDLQSVKDKDEFKPLVKKYKSNIDIYGINLAFSALKCNSLHSLRYLLTNGVSVNSKNEYGDSLLHYAASSNDIKSAIALLENGANIDIRNKEEATPLHIAAAKNNEVFAELLLANNCNKDAQAKGGMTAIMYAARVGSVGLVTKLLKSGADIDVVNCLGQNVLEIAKNRGVEEIVKKISEFVEEKDTKDAGNV